MAAYDNVGLLGRAVARDITARVSGVDLLLEALLCRGHLVTQDHDTGVVRCREPRDHAELQERFLVEEGEAGARAVRFPDSREPASVVSELLLDGPQEDQWTSITTERAEWAGFRALKYGVRLHPSQLELGVALLVRVLPLVSVPTEVSGHGRAGKFFLRVDIDGNYGRAWVRFLLEQELRHLLPPTDVGRLRQGLRYSRRIVLGGHDEDLASALDSFWRGQRLARLLLDSERGVEVRRRRRRIVDSFAQTERPTPNDFRRRCVELWGSPVWEVPGVSPERDHWGHFEQQFPVGPVQCVREPPAGADNHTVLLAVPEACERFECRDVDIDQEDWFKLVEVVNRRRELGALPISRSRQATTSNSAAALVSAFPRALIEEGRAQEIVAELEGLRAASRAGKIKENTIVIDIAPAEWSQGIEDAFLAFSRAIAADANEGRRQWVWVTGT